MENRESLNRDPLMVHHIFQTRLILVIIGLGILNIGCILTRWIPIGYADVPGGGILFVDDFSEVYSGWDTWSDDLSLVEYNDDQLRMVVKQPFYDFRTSPGLDIQDARLQVTATLAGGPEDNFFGLVCRYRDESNYYGFLASSDGYGGIIRVRGGDYEVISGGQLQFDQRIEQDPLPNRLEAQCIGPRLTFLVNDQMLYEVGDPELLYGKVGLMTGSYGQSGVDIRFDDFIVLRP
jgi:hypothetical protein